ncbi:MAG: hypothetical protein Hals2KO_20910 [Halioglobus sp.]
MLNQLLRFTLVSGALLWLRPRWKGLLALIVFVVLVHVLHGEYLGYVELSGNDEFLVWSFVLKWLALVSGVLAYLFLAVLRTAGGTVSSIDLSKSTELSAAKKPTQIPAKNDGFDFLRDKKQLQTRAEKLLNRELRK